MEPNHLCKTLIAYGSYAPGGTNHHVFSDLPGEWVRGKMVATAISQDIIGPREQDVIEAWTIRFGDCTAKLLTPEWREQKRLLYYRWKELDRRMGAGWGRGSMRWWPADSEPVPGKNGMIAVNVYLPLDHFPGLVSVEAPLAPFAQKTLDIWVGYFEDGDRGFSHYFGEDYSDDDDVPISEFAAGQGETWIDHDFVEAGFADSPESIGDVVDGHSWADQYRKELGEQIVNRGITRYNSFVFATADQVKNPCSVSGKWGELHYMGQFNISTA